jgi:hypothetical protein
MESMKISENPAQVLARAKTLRAGAGSLARSWPGPEG